MAYITKLEEELELEILQLKQKLEQVRGFGKNKVIQGDCLEVLKSIPDNYFDSLITDPPCGISFMGKNWDDHKGGMLQWINWMSEVMSESLRTMKPGACGLVWSIPRTSHWTGMALELTGFRLIDVIHVASGQGFPKGQDIGKHIDALYGAEREVVATPEAKQYDGWKTPALKPAVEGWWLVQKPISESSIARNILKHGVGGLNIEACRIGTEERIYRGMSAKKPDVGTFRDDNWIPKDIEKTVGGRYPANLILSCSADCDGDRHSPDCPVTVIGEQSGICANGYRVNPSTNKTTWFGKKDGSHIEGVRGYSDQGTAARYFKQLPFDPETIHSVYYQAKASTKDRSCGGTVENTHPTVKSTALMEYFIKLITPPNGMVLDLFGGSGTTAVAAKNLGFNYTLIEREQEYIEIINQRLNN